MEAGMELWVLLIIIAQLAWVLEIFIDKYLVSTPSGEDGHSVGTLVLVSALFNIVVAAAIFGGLSFYYGFESAVAKLTFDFNSLSVAIAVGVMEILWLIPYFYAIHHSDETSAPPVFQTIPIFGFALGFLVFGEVPTVVQVGGGSVILLGSILLNLEITKRQAAEGALDLLTRKIGIKAIKELTTGELERLWKVAEQRGVALNKKAFGLMLLASFIIALSAFLFKDAAESENFWGSAFWMALGAFSFGVCLWLSVPGYRRQLTATLKRPRMLKLNLANEVVDNIAMLAFYGAVVLGPSVAVVQLSNAFQPILILAMGAILARWGTSRRHTEMLARHHIERKVVSIVAIVLGSLLVFT
jgi:drug/metabolite transporter (DMT)-like permease